MGDSDDGDCELDVALGEVLLEVERECVVAGGRWSAGVPLRT